MWYIEKYDLKSKSSEACFDCWRGQNGLFYNIILNTVVLKIVKGKQFSPSKQ